MADKKISALPAATTPLTGSEVLPIVQGGTTDKVSVANLTAGRDVDTGTVNATGNLLVDYGGTERFIGSVYAPAPSYRNGMFVDAAARKTEIATGSADGTGYIVFTTGGRYERFRVTYDGNFVVGTAGKGIDFSANTGLAGMTSELFDWYEEGTWTVTWTSLTGTPNNTTGYYTRLGRMVHFTYATDTGGITGIAGTTRFSLPYAPSVQATGTQISENVNNGGTTLILPATSSCYPSAFSSNYMVFSGSYIV